MPAISVLWVHLQTAFLKSGAVDILDQIILYCGCLVYCRIFNSIHGLYALEASGTSPLCPDNKTCL